MKTQRRTTNACLVCLALILTCFLIVEFNTVVVIIRSAWRWILTGFKFARGLITKTILRVGRSVLFKRALRPALVALGVTGLLAGVSRVITQHVKPKVAYLIQKVKHTWGRLPWHLRSALIAGIAVIAILLGFGLFMVPVGFSFASRLFTKIQVKVANSLLSRKTRRLRLRVRHLLRESRHRPFFRHVRGVRYWLIMRERRAHNWAKDRLVKSVSE